jgi:hypothetical protein
MCDLGPGDDAMLARPALNVRLRATVAAGGDPTPDAVPVGTPTLVVLLAFVLVRQPRPVAVEHAAAARTGIVRALGYLPHPVTRIPLDRTGAAGLPGGPDGMLRERVNALAEAGALTLRGVARRAGYRAGAEPDIARVRVVLGRADKNRGDDSPIAPQLTADSETIGRVARAAGIPPVEVDTCRVDPGR